MKDTRQGKMKLFEMDWSYLMPRLQDPEQRVILFKNASKDGWGKYIGPVVLTQNDKQQLNNWYRKNKQDLSEAELRSFASLAAHIKASSEGKHDGVATKDINQSSTEQDWTQVGDAPTEAYS